MKNQIIISSLIFFASINAMNLTHNESLTVKLGAACAKNQLSEIRRLITQENANPNATTFFDIATRFNPTSAQYHISAGNDLRGSTHLLAACKRGQTEVVKLLLSLGAKESLEAKNNMGYTALMTAACGNFSEIIETLLSYSAQPNNTHDITGHSALGYACTKGTIESVNVLLKAEDIDINLKGAQNYTALHMACKFNHYDIVELLLADERTDVNVEAHTGETPHSFALKNNNRKLVKLLNRSGADPEKGLILSKPETNEFVKKAIRELPSDLQNKAMIVSTNSAYIEAAPEKIQRAALNRCAHCNKGGFLKKCGGCENVRYCNKACQKADWKNHKPHCEKSTK